MKVALIQFNASANKKDNLSKAEAFVLKAIKQKAKWILLPEIFSFRGQLNLEDNLDSIPENIPGSTTQLFKSIAIEHKVNLLLGSIFENSTSKKAYNTSIAINPKGELRKYRKINLFDARLGDRIIKESDYMLAGKSIQQVGVGTFNVGLSICYDLRFPNIYQQYKRKSVDAITVPSCFTKTTGQAHWEVLLRARAIENLCYVLAPNQVGQDARGVESYGNSMIINPWGEIEARGSNNKEEIIYGQLAKEKIIQARAKLPGIANIPG